MLEMMFDCKYLLEMQIADVVVLIAENHNIWTSFIIN